MQHAASSLRMWQPAAECLKHATSLANDAIASFWPVWLFNICMIAASRSAKSAEDATHLASDSPDVLGSCFEALIHKCPAKRQHLKGSQQRSYNLVFRLAFPACTATDDSHSAKAGHKNIIPAKFLRSTVVCSSSFFQSSMVVWCVHAAADEQSFQRMRPQPAAGRGPQQAPASQMQRYDLRDHARGSLHMCPGCGDQQTKPHYKPSACSGHA